MISATLEKIESAAEKIRSDEQQTFSVAAVDGDHFRQGDIYIWKRDSIPSTAKRAKKQDAQLAPGTTKGSRHILDSLRGVEVFQVDSSDPLQGPFLQTDRERVVTHPEHGNVLLPSGCYEITYQLAYAEERRRIED